MPEAYKKLAQTQPGTSVATAYTVPGATSVIVKHIRAVNVSASPTTIKLFHDGSGDANVILPAITLGPGEFLEWDGTLLMEAADTLQAQAGAATAITLTVYGIELS